MRGTIVECHGDLAKRDADIEYRIVTWEQVHRFVIKSNKITSECH